MYIRPLVYNSRALSLTWFPIQTSWLLHPFLWPSKPFPSKESLVSPKDFPSIRTRLSTNCASCTLRQLGALTRTHIMLAWIALRHTWSQCVSSYVFLPQIIRLIIACSLEPRHTYDVVSKALGSKVHQYGQEENSKRGAFIFTTLP